MIIKNLKKILSGIVVRNKHIGFALTIGFLLVFSFIMGTFYMMVYGDVAPLPFRIAILTGVLLMNAAFFLMSLNTALEKKHQILFGIIIIGIQVLIEIYFMSSNDIEMTKKYEEGLRKNSTQKMELYKERVKTAQEAVTQTEADLKAELQRQVGGTVDGPRAKALKNELENQRDALKETQTAIDKVLDDEEKKVKEKVGDYNKTQTLSIAMFAPVIQKCVLLASFVLGFDAYKKDGVTAGLIIVITVSVLMTGAMKGLYTKTLDFVSNETELERQLAMEKERIQAQMDLSELLKEFDEKFDEKMGTHDYSEDEKNKGEFL